MPCVLCTKKRYALSLSHSASHPPRLTLHLHTLHTSTLRYVGWSYESPDQKVGAFDAKGIETVRRDGCPAEAKLLEKCLRLLFTTNDLSAVKAYALRQFDKTLSGRASLQV